MPKFARPLLIAVLFCSGAVLTSPACAGQTDPAASDPAESAIAAAPDDAAAVLPASTAAPAAVVLTTPARPAASDAPITIERAAMPIDPAAASHAGGLAGLTLSANAALVSEYRFRGVNLSGGNPALQAGVELAHTSGFYAGGWASTLDNQTVGYGEVEVDVYGGWSGDIAEGLTANLGFMAYFYPDAPAGNFNYYEIYASLAFTLGPVSATLGAAYDPRQNGLNFGGLQRDNLYAYTDVSAGIPRTPFTITAHLGYTDGALSFDRGSKNWDWSIGVSMPIAGPLTASIAYVDAAQDVAVGAFNPTSSTVLAKLSARF